MIAFHHNNSLEEATIVFNLKYSIWNLRIIPSFLNLNQMNRLFEMFMVVNLNGL